MANDHKFPDDVSIGAASPASDPATDPADEVPVPPAMSPAEVDERAQVVEALRGTTNVTDASIGDERIPPADA